MNDFNQQVIDEFRSNEGKVGGPFEGAPMILLTTTGAKSGEQRTTPLVCREGDDGTIFVFASKAGAQENPAWYHNVLAHPQVTVEKGTERYAAIAKPLQDAKRDEIWEAHVKAMPNFGEYERKTSRTIPVIELRRA
jgi:deazaflavin-dependent oxidoreductase (nitroreductase family)